MKDYIKDEQKSINIEINQNYILSDKTSEQKEMNTLQTYKIPISNINELGKSICKISYKIPDENDNLCIISGTGFFMRINEYLKCLITNHHVIPVTLMKKNIEVTIEIYNGGRMKLKLENRFIKFKPESDFDQNKLKKFPELDIKVKELDITIIEIKDNDEIVKDIKFLNYDLN